MRYFNACILILWIIIHYLHRRTEPLKQLLHPRFNTNLEIDI